MAGRALRTNGPCIPGARHWATPVAVLAPFERQLAALSTLPTTYGETVQPHKAAASVGLSRPRHSCWSADRCCSNDCEREGCQLNFNLRRHVFEPGCPWVYLHTYKSLGACSFGSCRAEHAASNDRSSVSNEQSEATVQQCRIMGLGACPVDFTVLEVLPSFQQGLGMQVV